VDHLPQLRDRGLLADQHARARAGDGRPEERAAAARRHDVRTGVTEGDELPVLRDRGEAPEPPPGHVLEEHALDRRLGAEGEDLLEPRLYDLLHPPDPAV
jgi:hypothetical protein